MKTTIQQLIEWIETDLQRIKEKRDTIDGEKIILERLEFFMTMEKQQIIDAYWGGLNGAINDYSQAKTVGAETIGIKTGGGAERYYFDTYEGNEQKQKLFNHIIKTTKAI